MMIFDDFIYQYYRTVWSSQTSRNEVISRRLTCQRTKARTEVLRRTTESYSPDAQVGGDNAHPLKWLSARSKPKPVL